MKTREINKLVDRAYSALRFLDNKDWTHYLQRCTEMAEEEERGHRRGAPKDWQWPKDASVKNAARMFAVKRIAERLTRTDHVITVKDILHTQKSAVYAASIADNYDAEIRAALIEAKADLYALADLDYVDFVNNGEKP